MDVHSSKILIIDDEPGLAQMAAQHLESQGFSSLVAHDGATGLRKVFEERPDLIVLDIMMPDMDGFDTCKRIRQMSDIPIIMLTAKGEEQDIIKGFEAGADDYVVKPFRPAELIARIKAVMRRTQMQGVDLTDLSGIYQDDWLNIDLSSRLVEVQGERIRLSATEFKLLSLLVKNSGQVVEMDEILANVWGPEYRDEVAYVRVYISHLRNKLEPDTSSPQYFLTERQVGYYFAPQN